MKVQTILETYKRIPANSIKCVNEGIVIKGDNCVIRVIPNLKREPPKDISSIKGS